MDDVYINSILSECDSARYPEGFLRDYEAMECLAHNDMSETLLVKNKQTEKYFIAKCYTDKTLLSHLTEADILKRLEHPGLPQYAGEYQSGMLCVIREYVEGTPLDKYAAQAKLDEEKAVSLISELCVILSYLHGQKPPVIHRDIKPQNLIVDTKGRLRLIDFGISRVYDKNAEEDTVCYGTRNFAAPEQYGFAQTDNRADIFSLGVLLGWLLTGESELKSIYSKINNRRLLRIVKKCTAFSPEKRYANVDKVRVDLLDFDGRRQKRTLIRACTLIAFAVCLCIGFAIGRYTDITPIFASSSGVVFEEPLIEQAVRLTLRKSADELIDKNDLLSVSEIYIYGNKAVGSYQEFDDLAFQMVTNDGAIKNGGLNSLKDLTKLKNLKEIRIVFEDITDLSALRGLEALEIIDLRHNPIKDVSPLAKLPALRYICLFDTRVSDISSLSACKMMENIDAGDTLITSMTAFEGIKSIRSLSLMGTPIKTLSGLKDFIGLEKIRLSDVSDGDLRPLLALPNLKEVYLDETLRQSAEDQLKHAGFKITFL